MTDEPTPSPTRDEIELVRYSARQLFAAPTSLADVAETGFLGLLTPQGRGGAGWHPVEACVVAEEAGRALASVSWQDSLVAASVLSGDARWAELVPALVEGTSSAGLTRLELIRRVGEQGQTIEAPVALDASPDLLVASDHVGFWVLDCRDGAARHRAEAALDTTRPSGVVESGGELARVEISTGSLIAEAAVLLTCADSLGALSSTITLIRDHLVQRMAFGRPLASFQVLQHRLADLCVLEAACRALVSRAATALGEQSGSAARLVAAAHSYFATRVTAALDDCIQLAGGIGFTWEFPVHQAMRRALANGARVRSRRASLDHLIDAPPAGAEVTSDDFRLHARKVIEDNVPFEMREGHRAPTSEEEERTLRSWYRTLYDEGLLGASWPVEWGGDAGYQSIHQLVVTEELIRARAPRPIDQVQLASHVLLHFGTPEQKAWHLPRIRRSEDIWCQLFSEPDCGSDLAGIKARATRQQDGSWVLSGQKTWTTDGHWAQYGLALLRTSNEQKRHGGITAFIVPMDAPRLEIRPKLTIGGAYEFNDVFLDGVTLAADQLVGAVGQGWTVAMSGLEIERFGVGGNVLMLELLLADLMAVAHQLRCVGSPAIERSDIRSEIARLAADAVAARAFVDDHIDAALAGSELPGDASIAKLLHTETYNRISRYGCELLTELGPPPPAAQIHADRLVDAWLWSRALTISGGSSEVMRNILAKRRLQLPQ